MRPFEREHLSYDVRMKSAPRLYTGAHVGMKRKARREPTYTPISPSHFVVHHPMMMVVHAVVMVA